MIISRSYLETGLGRFVIEKDFRGIQKIIFNDVEARKVSNRCFLYNDEEGDEQCIKVKGLRIFRQKLILVNAEFELEREFKWYNYLALFIWISFLFFHIHYLGKSIYTVCFFPYFTIMGIISTVLVFVAGSKKGFWIQVVMAILPYLILALIYHFPMFTTNLC